MLTARCLLDLMRMFQIVRKGASVFNLSRHLSSVQKHQNLRLCDPGWQSRCCTGRNSSDSNSDALDFARSEGLKDAVAAMALSNECITGTPTPEAGSLPSDAAVGHEGNRDTAQIAPWSAGLRKLTPSLPVRAVEVTLVCARCQMHKIVNRSHNTNGCAC